MSADNTKPPAQWGDPNAVNAQEFHKRPMGPPTFTNSALKKSSSEVTPPPSGAPTFYRNKTVDERDSDTRKSFRHYLNFFILVNLAQNFVKIKSNGQI